MRKHLAVLLLTTALTTTLMASVIVTTPAHAEVNVSVDFDLFGAPAAQPIAVAPPALPVYVVPPPPEEGLLWQPGHWRWDGYDYFWVPGTWVRPPAVGLLWTPGYWGWVNGAFAWHEGYWGPHVGYYGGVDYGGGYGPHGFAGGAWHGGTYVVERTVINVTHVTNVSFAGGPGGTRVPPTAEQNYAAREHHVPPTQDQRQHAQAAMHNPNLSAPANHGRPPVAASGRPGDFEHNPVAASAAGPRNEKAEQHNTHMQQHPEHAQPGAAMPRPRPDRPHEEPHEEPHEGEHR